MTESILGTVRAVRHFLVVYDRRHRHLVGEVEEFATRAGALSARWAADAAYRDEAEIEVVVLSAASDEALRTTHGRYFKSVAELAAG